MRQDDDGYEIVFTPTAEMEFARLPEEAQEATNKVLYQLSISPTEVSRRSVFPYPPNAQICGPIAIAEHRVTILFVYGANETELIVIGIGYVRH